MKFDNEINSFQDLLIQRLNVKNTIAITKSLKIALVSIFTTILFRKPLILSGPTFNSKTIAVNIVLEALNSEITRYSFGIKRNESIFRGIKFNGSDCFSVEEIEQTIKRYEKKK